MKLRRLRRWLGAGLLSCACLLHKTAWPLASANAGASGDAALQITSHVRVTDDPIQTSLMPGETTPARTRFGHASDYSWLIGELRYLAVRNVWRLRFAAADEDGSPGSSVTLVDPGPMRQFKSGETVRVLGSLVPLAESWDPRAAYRVMRIEVPAAVGP
jgi:hypothetical protein